MTSSFFSGAPTYENTTAYDIPPVTPSAPGSAFNFGDSVNGVAPAGTQLWNLNDGDGGGSCERGYWEFERGLENQYPKYYYFQGNIFCNYVQMESTLDVAGDAEFESDVTIGETLTLEQPRIRFRREGALREVDFRPQVVNTSQGTFGLLVCNPNDIQFLLGDTRAAPVTPGDAAIDAGNY